MNDCCHIYLLLRKIGWLGNVSEYANNPTASNPITNDNIFVLLYLFSIIAMVKNPPHANIIIV